MHVNHWIRCAVAMAALATTCAATAADKPFVDVGRQEAITVLAPASPWLPAFSKMVALYEAQTGNSLKLDVNPYAKVLDKARNDFRGGGGAYDVALIDSPWSVEMYEGGFLAPLATADPAFQMPKEVLSYGDSGYWNAAKRWRTSDGGQLMGFTVMGNVEVWYYRSDVFKEKGLAPPKTWKDVRAVCAKLQSPPAHYGFVVRADREGIRYTWMDWAVNGDGAVLKDPENGDYTVVLNSPQNKAVLDQYIDVATHCGPPHIGAFGQGDVVQSLATGKALQGQLVLAAWASLQDPKRSAVVGKLDVVPLPSLTGERHGAAHGNWLYVIAKAASPAHQKAAAAFARWFLSYDAQYAYAKAGGIPNRTDVLKSDLAKDPALRWIPAYLETMQGARQEFGYIEGPQVVQILDLRLNQALIGQMSSGKALNLAASEIRDVLAKSGRRTGLGMPALPE